MPAGTGPVDSGRAPRRGQSHLWFMRSLAYVVFVGLLVGCGPSTTAPSPSLVLGGTWVFDPTRADRLLVVQVAPEGPERERALERALEDMATFSVTFAPPLVTLKTDVASRTVPYRIRQIEGSIVELERDRDGEWVSTSLAVEGDRLTWFDVDGDVEFVFRRTP